MGWLPTKASGRAMASASAALTMAALVLPTSVSTHVVGRGAPHGGEQRGERGHRRGEHAQVGAGDALGHVGRDAVDHAVPQRWLEALPPTPDRDDLPGEPFRPSGLRHRASEEAEPEQGEAADHASLAPASTFLRALTRRRFSSGVPTVTRSALSIPKLVMGRTMTPSLSSQWKTSIALRPTSTRMKLARDGIVLEAEGGELVVEIVPSGLDHAQALEDVRLVLERGQRRHLRHEFTLNGWRMRFSSDTQSGSATA